MKTLVEIVKDADHKSYYLEDSRLNQTFALKNFTNVKRMPNDYFCEKFRQISPATNSQTNNIWVLYGRQTCPFCKSAIRSLTKTLKGKDEFILIDIEAVSRYDKQSVLSNLSQDLGQHSTVPIIYHNNQFVGGNSELTSYLKNLKSK